MNGNFTTVVFPEREREVTGGYGSFGQEVVLYVVYDEGQNRNPPINRTNKLANPLFNKIFQNLAESQFCSVPKL